MSTVASLGVTTLLIFAILFLLVRLIAKIYFKETIKKVTSHHHIWMNIYLNILYGHIAFMIILLLALFLATEPFIYISTNIIFGAIIFNVGVIIAIYFSMQETKKASSQKKCFESSFIYFFIFTLSFSVILEKIVKDIQSCISPREIMLAEVVEKRKGGYKSPTDDIIYLCHNDTTRAKHIGLISKTLYSQINIGDTIVVAQYIPSKNFDIKNITHVNKAIRDKFRKPVLDTTIYVYPRVWENSSTKKPKSY